MPQFYPVDGRATPASPGDIVEYKVPDMYGRPWAQIWEEYHETGMERPEDETSSASSEERSYALQPR